MSVAPLEQTVAALQNAVVVAMEEVDELRSQVFNETGKLQREFRDAVDAVVRGSGGGIGTTPRGLFADAAQSPRRQAELTGRIEYLELALRALQDRRDSTPTAVDALMNQMRRWTEATEAANRQLEARLLDAIAATESKLRHAADERIRESEAALKRTLSSRVDQHDASLREMDTKIGALTTMVNHLDRRIHAAEEGLGQLDAEQNEVTNALHQLRDQQRRLVRSPTRRMGPDGFDATMPGSSFANDGAATPVLHESASGGNFDSQHQQRGQRVSGERRPSPSDGADGPGLANMTAALEYRAANREVLALRQDVSRCVTHIERLMEEQQRLQQQQHQSMQSVQRLEHSLDGARDRLELDIKTELQRLDTLQKTFFSRQEQVLNAERHQLGVKIAADLQRMHQRQVEESQKAEFRRIDDIRSAQTELRDEFSSFVVRQREEHTIAEKSLDDRVRKVVDELKAFVAQEVTQQSDAARRSAQTANDDLRKLAARTTDELKRVKQQMEEQNLRADEHSKFMNSRVQQILDAEVHRFDQIAFEFSSKLQKQVDEEVQRVVSGHEGSLSRDLESYRESATREIKNIREELGSLRSSLQAIAAPSNALSSLDTRVDVLRRDVLELHEAVGRVHDLEARIQSNLSTDTRLLVESLKSEVLRDVSQHILRFDQALVDLSQENASLRMRLAGGDFGDAATPTVGSHSRATYTHQFPTHSAERTQLRAPQYHDAVGAMSSSANGTSSSTFRTPSGGPAPVAGTAADARTTNGSSIFARSGGGASNADLVTSQPRSSATATTVNALNHSSASAQFSHAFSRYESPDRAAVLPPERYAGVPYGTDASGLLSNPRGGPRDDPLVGVFGGEFEGSP